MIVVVLGVLGLCFGSFVNALVWRLHEKSKKTKTEAKKLVNFSIWNGRSMCPNCHHELAAVDLVPILSWLWLRGKCRYCNKPISVQYPIVEAATAVLFILSYTYWPHNFNSSPDTLSFFLWLAIVASFMALATYDLRWMLLPNRLVSFLLGIAALQVIVRAFQNGVHVVVGAILGAVIIGGLFYALFIISDGQWIGGGDVKLGAVLGLIAGSPFRAILVVFIASWLGSIVGLGVIAAKKTNLKKRIPFGPFLILATTVIFLWGTSIINWGKIHFLY